MKSGKIIAFILMLACMPFGVAQAEGYRADYFPSKGTPYALARAVLLKRGLIIAVDRRPHPQKGIFVPRKLPSLDKNFPEVDCEKQFHSTVYCRALFLETHARGWRTYVVVEVDPKDKTVADVHYPYDVEGLPAIPGPLAPDVPQLKGSYLKARKVLRALGFKPTQNSKRANWSFNEMRVCFDRRCTRQVPLPETQCSATGMEFCSAYWISPNKRVLSVTTIGEQPRVYFVAWSTWKALRMELGQ